MKRLIHYDEGFQRVLKINQAGVWLDVKNKYEVNDFNIYPTQQVFVKQSFVDEFERAEILPASIQCSALRDFNDPTVNLLFDFEVPIQHLHIEREVRNCSLVICFDYGKNFDSVGFTVNETFYNGGPAIHCFNAYSSSKG